MKPLQKCPVCERDNLVLWATAKDYEYFSSDRIYSYYQCRDCKTIFIDPIPISELKKIYPSNYYSFVGGKKNWAFRIKEWLDQKKFAALLKQIKAEKINVLDIGGGTGWLLDTIKKTDPRISITQVVDIDPSAKKTAEQNGHLYFEGPIEEFETEVRFHFILMLNLVEHVSDPESVLRNVSAKLTDDGIILVKTPNTISIDSKVFKKTYWGGLHCPRHWIIFSKKSFLYLLQKTSLSLHSLKYTQAGAFWAFSILIYLKRKKILKADAERPVIFHPLFPFISALFAGFDFIFCLFGPTSQMNIVLKKKIKESL